MGPLQARFACGFDSTSCIRIGMSVADKQSEQVRPEHLLETTGVRTTRATHVNNSEVSCRNEILGTSGSGGMPTWRARETSAMHTQRLTITIKGALLRHALSSFLPCLTCPPISYNVFPHSKIWARFIHGHYQSLQVARGALFSLECGT